MPRARNSGKRAIRPNRTIKRKNADLKYQRKVLQKVINTKFKSKVDAGDIFVFFLFIISIGLIIGGGILGNFYSIVSGTILLIFLYFSLK